MPCIATIGQFYRHPISRKLFEVTHAMDRMIRVVDCVTNEPRILIRAEFERGMEQVSA